MVVVIFSSPGQSWKVILTFKVALQGQEGVLSKQLVLTLKKNVVGGKTQAKNKLLLEYRNKNKKMFLSA